MAYDHHQKRVKTGDASGGGLNLLDNLVAAWPCDESVEGSDIIDYSGRGNHAVADGDVKADDIAILNNARGAAGNSIYADVGVSEDFNFGSSPFSISTWWYKQDGALRGLFGRCIDDTHRSWSVYFSTTMKMIVSANGTDYEVISTGESEQDAYHHAVFVWDGSYLRCWSDGVAQAPVAFAGPVYDNSSYVQFFSYFHDNITFDWWGRVDETFIWKGRALGQAEVDVLYGGGSPPEFSTFGNCDFYPTTAAELILAANTYAKSGDTIHLPTDTLDLTTTVLNPSAGVSITGNGVTNSIVQCSAIFDGGNVLSNFAIDETGQDLPDGAAKGIVEFRDGTYTLTNMRIGITTATEGNAVQFNAVSAAVIATCTDCEFDHGFVDGVSSWASNTTLGEASRLDLVDCDLHHCGDGGTDQVLTSHYNFGIYMQGGTLESGGASLVLSAPMDRTSPLELTEVAVTQAGGHAVVTKATNCTITGCSLWLQAGGRAEGNTIDCEERAAIEGINCVYKANAADATVVIGNLVKNSKTGTGRQAGIQIDQQGAGYGTGGTFYIVNNTITDCGRGIYIREEQSPTVTFYNNITDATDATGADVFIYTAGGGTATVTGNYNHFETGDFDGTYTPGANDIITGTADIDPGTFVPTAEGNCDGAGYDYSSALSISGYTDPTGATVTVDSNIQIGALPVA